MASTVMNMGAVNVIAVTSASGIIVTAANRKNMLTVPDNERSAWSWPAHGVKIRPAWSV